MYTIGIGGGGRKKGWGGCASAQTPTTEQSANESTRDLANTFDCDAMEKRGAVQSLAGLSIS